MSDEVPAVEVGQTWERTRYGALHQVVVQYLDPLYSRPGKPYWRVRGERGSTVRGDRFNGRDFRFIEGPRRSDA